MPEQLYQIIDEFPFQERVTTYHGLTLKQAAIRMDDLIDVGEQTILADWNEPCEECNGNGRIVTGECLKSMSGPTCSVADCPPCQFPETDPCSACAGDGKRSEPWEHTDEETGREVTMTRAPIERTP